MLEPGDVFVNLTIGVDPGTYDSLLITAPGDLRCEWNSIIAVYRKRIAEYEAAVESLRTFGDLFPVLDAVRRPLDGGASASWD